MPDVCERLRTLIYHLNEGICRQRELVAELEAQLAPLKGQSPPPSPPLEQRDRDRLYAMARARGLAGEEFMAHIAEAQTLEQGVAISAALKEIPKPEDASPVALVRVPGQVLKQAEGNGHGATPIKKR